MSADWARPVVQWQLSAVDQDKIKAFYSALFNWDIGDGTFMKVPVGIGGPEPGPAGMIIPGAKSGVSLAIQVRDLRTTLDRAVELGGKITLEVMDQPGGGPTIAGIEDPEGNMIILVQQ